MLRCDERFDCDVKPLATAGFLIVVSKCQAWFLSIVLCWATAALWRGTFLPINGRVERARTFTRKQKRGQSRNHSVAG